MRFLVILFSLLFSLLFVNAQIASIIDGDGNTIVEDITIGPAGLPTTIILSTVISTPATTAPVIQQGPVGQPVSTPTDELTVFRYTTLDADGDTVVLTGTFTPTFPATTPFTPTSTGSILDYSQYLSLVGTNTVASAINGAGKSMWRVSSGVLGVAVGIVTGVLGGVWLVIV